MIPKSFPPHVLISQLQSNILTLALVLVNLLFNIVANGCFKLSAESGSIRGFITWQVVGNLSGFITVITLTEMLRYVPLHVAFPVTTGLAVIGVQMVSGRLFFGESVSSHDWLGAFLVVIGIMFLTKGE
jgi:multidrug transporter EmrE-like cation transporter